MNCDQTNQVEQPMLCVRGADLQGVQDLKHSSLHLNFSSGGDISACSAMLGALGAWRSQLLRAELSGSAGRLHWIYRAQYAGFRTKTSPCNIASFNCTATLLIACCVTCVFWCSGPLLVAVCSLEGIFDAQPPSATFFTHFEGTCSTSCRVV